MRAPLGYSVPMASDHQRIATLTDRTYVEGVYSIDNPQLAQTRTKGSTPTQSGSSVRCLVR